MLKKKNTTVDPTETRAELLQHVHPFKMLCKTYELDQNTNEQVIRLHDYHNATANIISWNQYGLR
jgi:hypothetical protein